jgi:hypothetical protein
MKSLAVVTLLCSLVAVQTVQSQQKKEEQKKTQATVGGRLVSIDVPAKTLKVTPWDVAEKRFKTEATRVLAWTDSMVVKSGSSSVMMGELLGGKPLDQQDMFGHVARQLRTARDLEGGLWDFDFEQTDDKAVVQKMSGVIAFSGMSFAGQVPAR